MKKVRYSCIFLCLVLIAMLLVGCNSSSSGGGSQISREGKTPVVTPTSAVETPTVAAATPTVVPKTPTVPVAIASPQITPTPSSDGRLTHFVGDLVTLDYPSYFRYKEVTIPGLPAGNHRFTDPMAPNTYIDVYEHDGDQEPGSLAAHTLSLTQAEMTQVATSGTSFTFTSAKGIQWTGRDSSITLSHTYPGYTGKYHIRILIHAMLKYQPGQTSGEKLVIGIIAPESVYQQNYQTLFLPIIQSLAFKSA